MLIYLNIFSHQRIHNSKYCVHNLIQGRHQMSYRQYLGSYQDLKEMKICKETAEKSSNNNKVFQQFVQVMNNYFSNVTVIKHQFCHKRKSIYKLSCASSSCNWSTNIPSFYYFDVRCGAHVRKIALPHVRCACEVRACCSFLKCDVRSHFCTLF